jgi:hypothetical protein
MSATEHGTTAAPPPVDGSLTELAGRAVRQGLLAGAAGLGVWLVLALLMPAHFFPAYLVAYVYFLGLGVGSLAVLLLHHLTGGAWGFIIRRPLEAATMTLPWMALLFLPLLLGMHTLYEWSNLDEVEAHEALRLKAGYLNVGFWLARAALYLAIWNGLAFLIRSGSVAQDATTDPSPTFRNVSASAPGLIAVFLSVTFASIDWVMSIEPEWYSTIYGVLTLVSWGLSAFCVVVAVATWLARAGALGKGVATPVGFNDLGNLMLAFTMLWAYMSYSQYLIIWSGNLAEEVPWYIRRSAGGWRAVAFALMVFHFFVPFFCLLVRENKRQPDRLWRIAALILVMTFVNDVWWVIPAYTGSQWLKLLALLPAAVGVGGVWVAAFARNLASRPLVPRHDPVLAEVLAHANHGGGH